MVKEKKKHRWIVLSAVFIAGLVTAVLVIVPLLIDSEQIKNKIQAGFKEATGGEIAYQQVGISLFPSPHVSISALTVSMPDVFTGKVERTDVYPDIFPLFTGKVKIKELEVIAPDVTLFVADQQEQGGKSSLDKVLAQEIPQVTISIDDGSLTVVNITENPFHIKEIDAVILLNKESFKYQINCVAAAWKSLEFKGSLNPETMQGKGRAILEELQPHLILDDFPPQTPFPVEDSVFNLDINFSLAGKDKLDVKVNGSLPHITIRNDKKKVTFRGIQFSGLIQKKKDLTTIQLQQFAADFPRSNMSGQFSIDNKTPQVELKLMAAGLDVKSVREITLFFSDDENPVHAIFYPFQGGDIPKVDFSVAGEKYDDLTLFNNMNIIFSLRDGKVSLAEDEQHQVTGLHGDIVMKDDTLSLQNVGAVKGRSALSVQTAHITLDDAPHFKINNGEATIFAEDFQSLIFRDGLAGDSEVKIDTITGQLNFSDMQITGPLLNPQEWQLNAKSEINNVTVSTPTLQNPVVITHADLLAKWDKDANKNKIKIQEVLGTFDKQSITLSGVVDHSVEGTDFDLQVKAEGLDFNLLMTGQDHEDVQQAVEQDTFWDMPVSGKLSMKSEYVLYDKYTFNAVQADFLVSPHMIESTNANVDLCGISVNGAMRAGPRSISFSLKPAAQDQDIDASLYCLFGDRAKFSGTYSFEGEISSQGAPNELVDALQGNFKLDVQGGRVFRSPLLLKIFSLLSATDVLKGELPKFSEEGFSYKFLKGQAEVKGATIKVNEVVFESKTLNLAGYGEVDVAKDKLDLVILVTTLNSVKSLIEKIPIIKDIAGGDLLTYPVKVTGTITDPKVRFLSPTELGKKAIGIVERTLKLPGEIIKPVKPKTKKDK